MSFQDDSLIFADDSINSSGESLNVPEVAPWHMLVVDDDESVLMVTRMALNGFKIDERPVEVWTANSLATAHSMLVEEPPSFAIIITDVVMETERAGLELVSWVRDQQELEPVRLVIRTGEPGSAPPEKVLNELDINDYWPKTEITPHRMRTILTGLARSYRDIHTLKEQKRLLTQMQARLFQQERLKVLGELASGVVHDFRNVLTPITAYSSMLRSMPDLPEEDRIEFAELIYEASRDAAAVVERLQKDYLGPVTNDDMDQVNLEEMLRGTAALARPKSLERSEAIGEALDVHVECPPDLMVYANSSELRQALLNLTINSLDAMDAKGKVTLSGSREDTMIVIEVVDTGCGMDADTLAQCRSAFFTTKGESGTGLGLATTVSTVENHGGQIDISSEVGRGTTITIQLPAERSTAIR